MPKLDGRHGKMPPLDGMNDSTFDDRKRSQGSIQAKAPVVGVDPNAPKKESVNLKKVNTDQEASPAREKAEEEQPREEPDQNNGEVEKKEEEGGEVQQEEQVTP